METGTERPEKRRVRFGPFELRTDTRELTRSGVQLNLQAKPEQILELLIARPGALVRREELRHSLWQENVFVDFDSGLNTAVNRLRAVLGDTADTPRYVETIPRLGYRFICPVQDVTEADSLDRTETFDPPFQVRPYVCSGALVDNLFWKLSLAVVLAWVCQFLFFALHLSGSAAVLHACLSN
jgi:DNA-binding winged helix-turn-helix (wHTH) protein